VPRKFIQSEAGSRKSPPFAGQSGAKVKNRSHFCGNGICTFGACDSRAEPSSHLRAKSRLSAVALRNSAAAPALFPLRPPAGIFLCTAEVLRQPLSANARQVPRKLIQSEADSRKSPPFANFDVYIGPLFSRHALARYNVQ